MFLSMGSLRGVLSKGWAGWAESPKAWIFASSIFASSRDRGGDRGAGGGSWQGSFFFIA